VLSEEQFLSMYSILTRRSSNYVRNKTFLISGIFGAVALSRNSHISFVKSVRLSVLLSTTAGRTSVKFDIDCFYENLSINSTNVSNLIKISGNFHYKLRILLSYFYCCRQQNFVIKAFSCNFKPLAKFRITTIILKSVCQSVPMEKLDLNSTDFHEIW
jgi:hypothetical protein